MSRDRSASGSTATERTWAVTVLVQGLPRHSLALASRSPARAAAIVTGLTTRCIGRGRVTAVRRARSSVALDGSTGATVCRAWTAVSNALVSAAGSTSRSAASRLANAS